MSAFFVVSIFIVSCVALSWVSSGLIASLVKVGKYLGWREFVIAFFVMAFAASLPNLFVDVSAAMQHVPEVALGDTIGGNLVDLTFVLGIAALFSGRGISAKSDMVQKTAVFTAVIAALPLLLIWDGNLSRTDGVILLGSFLLYAWWLFSEKGRFSKVYGRHSRREAVSFGSFAMSVARLSLFVALMLVASQAVIWSAKYFAGSLGVSLALVGVVVVGLGNAFPETYFSIISARKEENWLVLGDLMGSVIVCATLVLGIIGLFFPFTIHGLALFFAARIFLLLAAVASLIFVITGKHLSKKEGLFLVAVYIVFLVVETMIPVKL